MMNFTSGYGQYHTDNPNTKTPKSYTYVISSKISEMMKHPPSMPKENAQWVLFTTYKSRDAEKLKKEALYTCLWADLVDVNYVFLELFGIIEDLFQCNFFAYTTTSATSKKLNVRLIIPLRKPCDGATYQRLQVIINNKLESMAIKPNRSTELVNQVCYLPNKISSFYDSYDVTSRTYMDWEKLLSRQLTSKSISDGDVIEEHDLTNINQVNYMDNDTASDDGYIPMEDRPYWLRGELAPAQIDIVKQTVGTQAQINQPVSTNVQTSVSALNPINTKTLPSPVKEITFADFAINLQIDEMKRQMDDDVFILNELALLGQITIFYAAPNTGKTLAVMRFLIDAVKCGNLNGENVFYINADDTHRGLVTKAEILDQYGISMLAPSHNGFTKDHVEIILNRMTNNGSAKGKVIIIDTLKKFADLMDKRSSSNFMELLRQFVSKGGSVVMLAHTNKHTDSDGKPVFQGTSDSRDDADCCYTIQLVDTNAGGFKGDKKVTQSSIIFENIKSRGDVAQSKSFHYEKIEGGDYQSILDSFEDLDEGKSLKLKEQARVDALLKENDDHIDCVLDGISAGVIKKTDIIQRLVENQGLSKPKARKVIDTHVGGDYLKGHRWTCVKGGDRNVKIYSKLRS